MLWFMQLALFYNPFNIFYWNRAHLRLPAGVQIFYGPNNLFDYKFKINATVSQ
jgi:hypothetical protein